MKLEHIKSFSNELEKIAIIGMLANAGLTAWGVNSAFKEAKEATNPLGRTAPIKLKPLQEVEMGTNPNPGMRNRY